MHIAVFANPCRLNMAEVVYVEVCQKACSTLSREEVTELVNDFTNYLKIETNQCRVDDLHRDKDVLEQRVYYESYNYEEVCEKKTKLKDHVDSIMCSTNRENSETNSPISLNYKTILKILVYRLSQEAAATETMQHESEELSVASHTILPAAELQGLWGSLYYDTDIKNELLNFINTSMMFADKKVDPNIISWNKVVLLHGPPGTGKTSLCRALAQKVSIRLSDRYAFVQLVEINSHSLFSKWFSESGKLVMKLFDEVKRLLDNPEALVCVLIDEVESLAHARKSCANGTEPSDAIRVVNALLTQLDQIKNYRNVLILTTSNVTEAIDLAFVDRADIKQYIGHPQPRAIYKIYRSCLLELMKTNFVTIMMEYIEKFEDFSEPLFSPMGENNSEQCLQELCKKSVGLSGRSLRKIPFLAHAMYVQTSQCSVNDFLEAMRRAIEKQIEDDNLAK